MALTHHHIVPRRVYLAVFLALVLLTVVTTLVAYLDLGRFALLVAMGIATFKASLVILYFMHVRYTTRLTWLVIFASFAWLGVLIVGTVADYLTRPVFRPPTQMFAPASPTERPRSGR